MVRTRSKSVFIERQNQNDTLREIRERAGIRHPINPKKSPRKRSILKQKKKEKRNSKKFESLLSDQKENLSKV